MPTFYTRVLDWNLDEVPPLRPTTVIVPHIRKAEQIVENKPSVAAPLANSTVGDDDVIGVQLVLVQIDFAQLGGVFEGAVVAVYGTRPRNAESSWNVATAQGTLVWIVGHVQAFSAIFLRTSNIYEGLFLSQMFEHLIAKDPELSVVPLWSLVLRRWISRNFA
jgi:hypothetical protein